MKTLLSIGILVLLCGIAVIVLWVNILGGGDSSGNETAPAEEFVYETDTPIFEEYIEVPAPKEVGLYIGDLRVASGNDNYQVVENRFGPTAHVYIDRRYTVDIHPSFLEGAPYIQTADGAAGATQSEFLSFSLHYPSTVYVAYDSAAASIPNWLASWTSTGETITVSESVLDPALHMHAASEQVEFRVYAKAFPEGTVMLGGNRAAGAVGAAHNYFVIVAPNQNP